MKVPLDNLPPDYARHYSSKALIALLPRLLSKTGMEVVAKIVQLYYVARSPEVPTWTKAAVCAGLGYLILTPDAVPDITPFVGFLDDIAVLSSVFTSVVSHISPAVKQQAESRLAELFPNAELPEPRPEESKT